MAIILDILLLGLCGFLVIYPYFTNPEKHDLKTNSLKEKLLKDKETIFKTLSEIEFDYHMGKIAQADYEELKNRYMREAGIVLKAYNEFLNSNDKKFKEKSDYTTIEKDIEKEIEEELKKLRNKKRRG